MADKMLEQRGGPHNTHEEHQSFISHAAEKFHLKKTEASITKKTVRGTGAAGSLTVLAAVQAGRNRLRRRPKSIPLSSHSFYLPV